MSLRERAIEAMAQAMWAHYHVEGDPEWNDIKNRARRGAFRGHATAAFAALTALLRAEGCKVVAREPTERMLDSGIDASSAFRVSTIYYAMHDAAVDALEPPK